MSLNRGFGPSPSPQAVWFAFFTPITSYNPLENKYYAEMGDGFPFAEGCTMHVKVKPETYYWWDGTEVTAEDRVYWHQVAAILNRGSLDAVPWEARFGEDKYEWKETKVGQPTKRWMKQNMNRAADGKRTVWKPIWEKARDASSEEERNKIADEAANMQLGIESTQPENEGYGHGLWRPVDWTETSITWEQFDKHPFAGESDIDQWEWRVISNQQTRFQTIEQDQLDTATIDLGASDQIQAPEDMSEVYAYPQTAGQALDMTWRTKHLKRRGVRRAINYIIDSERLAGLIQGSGAQALKQFSTAMPDRVAEDMFGEEFLGKLIQYGATSKPEAAKKEMQRAGYSKEGDRWVGPDGDAIEDLSLISTSGATDSLIANTISSELNQFGIGNSLLTMEGTQFQNTLTETFDYDLALFYDSRRGPGLDAQVNEMIEGGAGSGFYKTSDPEKCDPGQPVVEYTSDMAQRQRIPVNPYPPYPGLDNLGAEEIQGEGEHIDPLQLSLNLRVAFPREQRIQWAKQIAWYNNFHSFRKHLYSFNTSQWMDTANFQITDDSKIRGVGPGYMPMVRGGVSSK